MMDGNLLLVWSEDENDETINDALRRLTGFSLIAFKSGGTSKVKPGEALVVWTHGDYVLRDYHNKASEIWRKK